MTTISIDIPNWLLLVLALAMTANAVTSAALAYVKYQVAKQKRWTGL